MFKHYRSCDETTIGRIVLDFLDKDIDAANLRGIQELATALQADPAHCECRVRQLTWVREELRVARKRQRSGLVDQRDLIADLIATRDLLTQELVNQ